MDLKVGNIGYSDKLESFYFHSDRPFGFKVRSIVVNSEGTKRLDKKYAKSKSLNAETIHTVLDNYLIEKNAQTVALAKYFVQKLMEIEVFFEKQTEFHLFGSSLFFTYDQGSLDVNSAQVRVIDFENHFPADGKIDENFLFGLRNARKLFEAFIEN